jgi:hypothetical protein
MTKQAWNELKVGDRIQSLENHRVLSGNDYEDTDIRKHDVLIVTRVLRKMDGEITRVYNETLCEDDLYLNDRNLYDIIS